MKQLLTILICVAALSHPATAAGPKVHIVVGEKAEAIEKFAAEEMAGQFKKLFEADVAIVTAAPSDATNVIHLGTKESSPLAAKLGDAWPKLSDQGHALKSLDVDGKKVLLIAGGSPRAVLWAAYELGWRFGIRYFPFGDLFPTAPTFTLAGFDVVLEPVHVGRVWHSLLASPVGPEAWGIDEHRNVLHQLAKLKYTELEARASELKSGPLVAGRTIAVAGDTVGRAAFHGVKVFDNPDFSGADAAGRRYAAEKLTARCIQAAQQFGMTTTGCNPRITGEESGFIVPNNLMGVLPAMGFRFWQTVMSEAPAGSDAVATTAFLNPSDAAWELLIISRISFEPKLKLDAFLAETLSPVCGEGVSERVLKAFDSCEQATLAIGKNEAAFSLPTESMLTRHYQSTEPPPAWWGEVRTHYLNAMNEMYRANTRAREGGRAFTLYYARRFEFGFEYMNVVEALRKAAIAKKAGDKDAQIAELEKALDSITNACNAMAAVARSNSDRGIIAIMNEYGYRPVQKLLEEADAN